MSNLETRSTRPITVNAIATILIIGAANEAAIGLHLAFTPRISTFLASHSIVADSQHQLLDAVLAFSLALLYTWMARISIKGEALAYWTLNTVAIVNIPFAFLQLPIGWIGIGLNTAILILTNVPTSRTWLMGHSSKRA